MEGIGLEGGGLLFDGKGMEGFDGLLSLGAGHSGILGEECLFCVVEEVGVVSKGCEGVLLCAGGGGVEVEVVMGDRASVAWFL